MIILCFVSVNIPFAFDKAAAYPLFSPPSPKAVNTDISIGKGPNIIKNFDVSYDLGKTSHLAMAYNS